MIAASFKLTILVRYKTSMCSALDQQVCLCLGNGYAIY